MSRRRDREDRRDGHRDQSECREKQHPPVPEVKQQRTQPADEIDAGFDHCRRVQKRRHRCRRLHRVWQPDV